MVWDTNFDLIQGRGTPNCLAIYYLVCFCQSSHVGGLPSQIRNYSPYRKNSLQCTISGLRPPRLTLTVFGLLADPTVCIGFLILFGFGFPKLNIVSGHRPLMLTLSDGLRPFLTDLYGYALISSYYWVSDFPTWIPFTKTWTQQKNALLDSDNFPQCIPRKNAKQLVETFPDNSIFVWNGRLESNRTNYDVFLNLTSNFPKIL